MTKKNVLAISLVAGVAAIALSAGTLAYFTDTTDTKHNVFTVGKVDIDLTETTDWSDPAQHVFMPGSEFEKDPTITVADDSQDAYVAAKITMNNALDFFATGMNYVGHSENAPATLNLASALTLLNQFVEGFDADEWTIVDAKDDARLNNGTVVITAIYNTPLTAGKSVTIFDKIKMPEDVRSEDIQSLEEGHAAFDGSFIDVVAYAIQANVNGNTLTTEDAATKLFGQITATEQAACETPSVWNDTLKICVAGE